MSNYLLYNADRSHIAGPVVCADDTDAAALAAHLGPGATFEVVEVAPTDIDPEARLAARKAAGIAIVDAFLIESDSWGMGRTDALAFLAKTDAAAKFLQLGRLEQARLALAATATDAYLTAEVRTKYVAQITDALQKNP